MNMTLAPIIVFAYNRPDHLKRTLDALAQNTLAKESLLYIYCDGPKSNASDEQITRVNKVREVAKKTAGFKALHIECAEQNKGLANSIISGVTDVISTHGRVIVLEDDLLTAPYFLKYMNEGLDYYQNRPSVYSITGYNYPPQKMVIPKDYEYDTYVCLRFCSWGWATWSDRWNQIDWRTEFYVDSFKHPHQLEAFNRGGDDMANMLYLQKEGRIDSWAIRCAYNQFVNHAVTIYPCKSHIDNIGFDGSGVHCNDEHTTEVKNDIKLAPENTHFVGVIYEDARFVNAFYNINCRAKRPLWKKMINYIYRKLGIHAPFVIKKEIYAH